MVDRPRQNGTTVTVRQGEQPRKPSLRKRIRDWIVELFT
jgi:hypothetical protein